MKQKVVVVGGSGMLGSMVADYLARSDEFEVAATTRSEELSAVCRKHIGEVHWRQFDAAAEDASAARGLFEEFDWVVNCVGIVKPLIHDDNASEVERACRINALFPHLLAHWTRGRARVLQIATDCVYSGAKGHYTEGDAHDPLDVYGKTKSLGEVNAPHVFHVRSSIIGPEPRAAKSLLEWLLGQPHGARIGGIVNHQWNAVTTHHFAKLCGGIIRRDGPLPHLQHLVPAGEVTKCELLEHLARCYDRQDVVVRPTEAALAIDRTLTTGDRALNHELWSAAGYEEPPSVPKLIAELALFDYRLKGLYLPSETPA
jgi:dTDP-4-dehydrorhamnose reductase